MIPASDGSAFWTEGVDMGNEDPLATQKAKAEADTATANARAAEAAADEAAANALKAKAEADGAVAAAEQTKAEAVAAAKEADAKAQKAQADADTAIAQASTARADADAKNLTAAQKAQADADKATADTRNSAAVAAKAEADADKTKAEARKLSAEAETAEASAGIPPVPTLPTIAEPADKAVGVQDSGGAGTALYTAAQALERLGTDVGHEVAWALGAKVKVLPHRYRDPRFDAAPWMPEEAKEPRDKFELDTRSEATNDPPESGPEDVAEEAVSAEPKTPKKVWVMDSMTPSESGIVLLELSSRLETFKKDLDSLLPEPPKPPPPEVIANAEAADDGVAELALNPLGLGAAVISTAGGLVNFGVQLVSALRSKYALYGRQVNLNRQALLSATAGVLLEAGFAVGWPRFATPRNSALVITLTVACQARDALDARLPSEPPTDALAKRAFERAKALIERFDAYVTSIMSAPAGGGHSLFLDAALHEAAMPQPDEKREDVLLYVDITAQGADAVMGYGVARGSNSAFLGFVQAYFAATNRDGDLIWAGTSTAHTSAKFDLALGTIHAVSKSDVDSHE